MLVVESDNKRLIEALNAVRINKEIRQCIYIPLSRHPSSYNKDVLVRHIGTIFGDPEGSIFLCEDGDVFLLSAGITSKIFISFKESLPKVIGEDFKASLEKTTRHAIDMRWDELYDIVKRKLSDLEESQKRQKEAFERAERERRRQEIIAIALDHERLEEISRRRDERKHVAVMFAEDDAFQRRLINMAISPDFFVSQAADGLSCIQAYIASAPDILFLDIGLPDISGHDILKKLLQIDPKAYVVMLSGNSHRDNVVEALKTGARGFIGKPFTKEKLFQYISKCSSKPLIKKTEVRA
jgi:two-component system chemotaxis response regulator CheY